MKQKNKTIFAIFILILIIAASVFVVVNQSILGDIFEGDKEPLSVKIFADSSEGTAPFVVNFSSIVTNCKGDVKYSWDFGNGNVSNEREPSTVYTTDGTYVCKLKITDSEGKVEYDSIKILVNKNKPPVVVLSINQNTIDRKFTWVSWLRHIPLLNMVLGYAGNQQQVLDLIEKKHGADYWGKGRIIVTAQISDPENDKIVSYNWTEQTGDILVTFGGKILLPTHNIKGNDSITIPELYTWMLGQHIVTLKVTDSAGNTANATIPFMVSDSAKEIKITTIKTLILTVFLNTIYDQYLTEDQKHLISDPLWTIIEPFDKVLGKIPGVSMLWGLVLSFIATKFPQPIPIAELNYTMDANYYNHSETINQNGDVNETVGISHTFRIINNDKENPAKDVYITLKNPVTKDEGLDDELEKENLVVTLETDGDIRTLYYNQNYTDGISLGDLNPGSESIVNITVKFLKDGKFKDNQNYSCSLYVAQNGADYARWSLGLKQPSPDEIKFYIRT